MSVNYSKKKQSIDSKDNNSENVSNPNETLSAVLSFLIPAICALIFFFFYNDQRGSVYIKFMLIAIAFLVCRILLFYLKILGYSTSRTERKNN